MDRTELVAFLNTLREVVPGLAESRLKTDLADMLDAHLHNIARCAALASS